MTVSQNEEIIFRLRMRMVGVDDGLELYGATSSSGIEIRGLSERDRCRQFARATGMSDAE